MCGTSPYFFLKFHEHWEYPPVYVAVSDLYFFIDWDMK